MSQQDGERSESEQGSRNAAARKSVKADANSREAVTKLIVKKVKETQSHDAEATKIRPEPRRLQKTPLMEVGQEDTAEEEEIADSETVTRLETAKTKSRSEGKPHEITLAKFEKREQLPSEEVKQEEQWQENKSIGWWVVIGGTCLVLILAGAVLLSSQWEADGMEQVDAPQIVLPTAESPFAGTAEEWFRARAGRISSQASVVLQEYAAAKSDQERSRWVRNPELFLKKADTWMRQIQPRTGEHDQADYEIGHIKDTGYLLVKTEDRDFMPMRVYFVRQGEELKIDWEASTAWSEMSFETIAKKQADYEKRVSTAKKQASEDQAIAKSFQESVLVRCHIRRRNEFYAGPYNDTEHASFMIISPDLRQTFWAYVERDSPLDLELKGLLDHGSFVVSLKKETPVTLRVRSGKKDALPSQLEVVELVHAEWLTP